MSRICLLCTEHETPGSDSKICNPCYDNAGEFLERNANRINAIPSLLETCRDLASFEATLNQDTVLIPHQIVQKGFVAVAMAEGKT